MAMMEGPTMLEMAEYTRKRPNRLLEQQLDNISYYTVYLRLRGCREGTDTAMSNPVKVSTLSGDMGKKAVSLFFLDQDLHEIGSVEGNMVNGIWTPGEELAVQFMHATNITREGFLHYYDDGLDIRQLAESAAKELAAV